MTPLTDLFQTLDTAPNDEARTIRWQRYGKRYRVTVEADKTSATVIRDTIEDAIAGALNLWAKESKQPRMPFNVRD